MKIAKLLFLIIFITLSCSREKEATINPTNLASKRQQIMEIARKYHNPELGLTVQKDSKLEKLSDEMIEKFDLKLFEQALQNFTAHGKEFSAKKKALGCKELSDKEWELLASKNKEAHLKFRESNQAALTACDSINKMEMEALQKAMQPYHKLNELLMEAAPKN